MLDSQMNSCILYSIYDEYIVSDIKKKVGYFHETKEIYMNGGNEIFMNLIPQWDGEDDIFDLNEVSLAELKQFPNLKQATIMTSNFDKINEIFVKADIDAELL